MNPYLWSAKPGVRLEDACAFGGMVVGVLMTFFLMQAISGGHGWLVPFVGLLGGGAAWGIGRLLAWNHRRFYSKESTT